MNSPVLDLFEKHGKDKCIKCNYLPPLPRDLQESEPRKASPSLLCYTVNR